MSAQEAIKTFFVTLRRSPIGTPWFHKSVLKSLGLVRRHDCVERANTATVRGQLAKVAHLVRIETDQMFFNRKVAEAQAAALKAPIRVSHADGAAAAAAAAAAEAAQLGGVGVRGVRIGGVSIGSSSSAGSRGTGGSSTSNRGSFVDPSPRAAYRPPV